MRHPRGTFRDLDGLAAASIGWTTPRLGDAEDARVAEDVASSGVNVFDLVPYVRDGAAEAALGDALARGAIARDEVVVMSRAGFLDEPVLDFGRHVPLVQSRYVTPGVFTWDELAQGNHTLAPAFLRRSIDASVRRLGTGLDVLFLASPAVQLSIASPRTFEERLLRAFEALERCVAEGTIARYGVANPAVLQLERAVALAREVAGGRHHLRVVQVPLSLHDAARGLPSDQVVGGHPMTTVRAASELGLYVCASGVLRGGATEYDLGPEARAALGDVVSDVDVGLQWARSFPGVGTALVGMRRATHIEQNARVVAMPPSAPDAAAAFVPEEEEGAVGGSS